MVMVMSEAQQIQLLTEIKESLKQANATLAEIREDLRTDRSWIWKVLMLTIGGAFAIVGVKLAIP